MTLEEFRRRTLVPFEDVDLLEERRPGFIQLRLTYWTSWIYSRLRKRYAVPFADPAPEIVLGWLTDIVQPEVYAARGPNPSADLTAINDARTQALEAIKEAADGELGLYDLPLRENNAASGVEAGGPLGYAEASPYTWTDNQAEALNRGR